MENDITKPGNHINDAGEHRLNKLIKSDHVADFLTTYLLEASEELYWDILTKKYNLSEEATSNILDEFAEIVYNKESIDLIKKLIKRYSLETELSFQEQTVERLKLETESLNTQLREKIIEAQELITTLLKNFENTELLDQVSINQVELINAISALNLNIKNSPDYQPTTLKNVRLCLGCHGEIEPEAHGNTKYCLECRLDPNFKATQNKVFRLKSKNKLRYQQQLRSQQEIRNEIEANIKDQYHSPIDNRKKE